MWPRIVYPCTPGRYIVEYLGAMVCGGIVEVVPSAEGDRYFLPKHRHKILLSEAAIMHQGLPIFGAVHEDIVGCFPKSGPAGKWSFVVLNCYLGLISLFAGSFFKFISLTFTCTFPMLSITFTKLCIIYCSLIISKTKDAIEHLWWIELICLSTC